MNTKSVLFLWLKIVRFSYNYWCISTIYNGSCILWKLSIFYALFIGMDVSTTIVLVLLAYFQCRSDKWSGFKCSLELWPKSAQSGNLQIILSGRSTYLPLKYVPFCFFTSRSWTNFNLIFYYGNNYIVIHIHWVERSSSLIFNWTVSLDFSSGGDIDTVGYNICLAFFNIGCCWP